MCGRCACVGEPETIRQFFVPVVPEFIILDVKTSEDTTTESETD